MLQYTHDKYGLQKYWFSSSDEDFETMNVLYKGARYSWALFAGHLVIEKLLKGIHALKNKSEPVPPKTHNLILLAQKSELIIPDEIKIKLQVINTFNIAARYDDYKNSFAQKCTA